MSLPLSIIVVAICLVLLILRKGDFTLGGKALGLTFYLVAKERSRDLLRK
jgi:hypothetical protein